MHYIDSDDQSNYIDGDEISRIYNTKDTIIQIQKEIILDYSKGAEVTTGSTLGRYNFKSTFKADVNVSKGKILIYPWTQTAKGAQPIPVPSKYILYIPYGYRNDFSLPYRAWYWGPTTFPFKIYTASKKGTQLVDNIITGYNINYSIQRRFGSKHFRMIPNMESSESYLNDFSIGLSAGFSAITLGDKTSRNSTFVDRSFMAFTYGLQFGMNYKSFSLLLGVGIDQPLGKIGDINWIFAGKPWLGLGAGFNIF